MHSAVEKAIQLILSADAELCNILSVTARMSLASSLIALLIGVPIGIWLGSCRFRGRGAVLVLNRTLMGLPPVVCGLLFYMLFSGVGPFRQYKLLFTVEIMVMAQVVLITPIVIGNMESYVSGLAPAVRETAKGLGLGHFRTLWLLTNECVYQIFSAYLLAFARSIGEYGSVVFIAGNQPYKTEIVPLLIMSELQEYDYASATAIALAMRRIYMVQ